MGEEHWNESFKLKKSLKLTFTCVGSACVWAACADLTTGTVRRWQLMLQTIGPDANTLFVSRWVSGRNASCNLSHWRQAADGDWERDRLMSLHLRGIDATWTDRGTVHSAGTFCPRLSVCCLTRSSSLSNVFVSWIHLYVLCLPHRSYLLIRMLFPSPVWCLFTH